MEEGRQFGDMVVSANPRVSLAHCAAFEKKDHLALGVKATKRLHIQLPR